MPTHDSSNIIVRRVGSATIWHVDSVKTTTIKSCTVCKLIMRMSTTLTSGPCISFELTTNKALKSYDFRIQNSDDETYFGALESIVKLLMGTI